MNEFPFLFNCEPTPHAALCRNIRHAFQTILREEGGLLSGCLYRGLLPTLLGIAPYVGLNFAVYETLKGARLTIDTSGVLQGHIV